uniref:USP6 N-terminal-like protein isoform X1 n=1 Tax=Callorhinus ursinus TaxID=34884 RepID=A0A3Q7PY92_CALUR|nr:USP6 N-terminal-like protein isoform X1 [Callorhinus ursinus]XP_025735018.1 USP6 N-terminal-like protein isoform X1 [Callorhinus ursinus]
MLRSWEHYRVRGQLWALLLDTEKVKSTKRGVYEKMTEQAQLFSRDIRQIDLDVNRTFQNHVTFRDRYGVRVRLALHGPARPHLLLGPGSPQ